MFGKNRIVTPKDFADRQDTLDVTSIFYTLQGEGPFAGHPAVFVRLAKCNLKCSFCDTYFDAGDTLTLADIIMRTGKAEGKFCVENGIDIIGRYKPLVVLTGGEPTMQPALPQMLEWFHMWDYETQIESNGIFWCDTPEETHVVVSPKCNDVGKWIKLNERFLQKKVDTLKFVVSADPASPYHDVPEFALKWRDTFKRDVYVSPMNVYREQPVKLGEDGTLEGRSESDERISFWTPGLLDLQQNQANHEHAAFLAMKHGIYLTLQAHLYASLP